ncbi:DNA modification methylase [Candidatus Nomurabacteria bacterium]|nr:DNA modification methylase [Candidatus Nomurabacteria bacterium]
MNKTIKSKVPSENLQIDYVPLASLRHPEINPRRWSKEATEQLKESITRYGVVDPLVVNSAPSRQGIIVGGNFRATVLKQMDIREVPVVYVNIPDLEKEKELNLRLNKNSGEFDLALLAEFDEKLLADIGFDSEELDDIFGIGDNEEQFDLEKELAKLDIKKINVKKGDIYDLSGSRLRCGDSTVEADMLALMGNERADMCFTDPPYILDYLRGKTRNGKPTVGFGSKKNRRYLETDILPPDFTERWMANVAKVQKPDFSIIVFEHPKNLRTIWNELEKHWKYRNTITWHLPNRVQGFAAKYKFFNKQDIALVGSSPGLKLKNPEPEADELLQTEYENALFATSGKPHWEGYEKGKKICPTDFIDYKAADEKSSGQGIIFGTKPLEILIPYIKVLTRRDDLILEPFGGSGSTLIAAAKMKRRCYLMEKSPVYAEVILHRWSKLTGLKPKLIHEKA